MIINDRRTIHKSAVVPGIVKFLLALMLLYEGWYLQKYPAIPGVLQLLAVLIVGATAILLLKKPHHGRNKLVKYWIAFGVYSLFAAMMASASMVIVLDSLFTYFSFIAMVYCAGVVSQYTKDYSWFSRAVMFTCVLNAIFAIFFGYAYKNGSYYVTTMSEFNNPNTLGLLMSIGTFLAAFPDHKPRRLEWLVRLGLIFVFLPVTINTGSRSAVLCEIAIVAMLVYSRLKNTRGGSGGTVKKMFFIFGVILAIMAAVAFIRLNNTDGSAIRRLIEKFSAEAFSGRTELYEEAWDIYTKNPIFGVGFNCFSTVSNFRYFTHSTYMELLACTGTIGFVLFLAPVIAAVVRAVRNFKLDRGRAITFLLMMLVSGFFGIVYYSMVFLMVLYIEISRMPPANQQKRITNTSTGGNKV